MARKALFEILQKNIVCFELSENGYCKIINESIPLTLSTLNKRLRE